MSTSSESQTQPTAYQIHQNVLAWRGCEQLYLDERTADIQFVFKSTDNDDTIETIPAHKAILSVISPVFDALLYGPFKQDGGDISINGTSTEAFREFLQFFYRRSVKIANENIEAVMELAVRYGIADCLNACIDLYKTTLNHENMCSGYELAIQFENQSLQEFCEREICENAPEIFKSTAFLQCKSNLLREILQLNGIQCNETVIFDGCMEWAKRACIGKVMDDTDGWNIRRQLGDLLYEIRFAGMTLKEFYARSRKYDGLLSPQEFQEIIGIIAAGSDADADADDDVGDHLKSKFNRTTRKWTTKTSMPMTPTAPILTCSRIDSILSAEMKRYTLPPIDCTIFSSNSTLKLTKIHCSEVLCADEPAKSVPFGIKILEIGTQQACANENVVYFRQMSLNPSVPTVIEFQTPIVIKPHQKYGIVLQFQWWNSSCFNLLVYKPEVDIADNISIKFYNFENDYGYDCQRFGMITQMDFATIADEM